MLFKLLNNSKDMKQFPRGSSTCRVENTTWMPQWDQRPDHESVTYAAFTILINIYLKIMHCYVNNVDK